MTTDEEKLVSRLLQEYEERAYEQVFYGSTKKGFGETVTEGEIKLITWCYRSRKKMMSRMLHE